MKRFTAILLIVLIIFTLSSCAAAPKAEENIDVDLTKLSSTMVYSEVYNMVYSPEKYLGKTVKMHGPFRVTSDQATGKNYFAVIISDATACCAQGIEFEWKGDHKYPDDYPEVDDEVTVIGTFNTYTEGEYQYVQLINADVTF